MLPLVNFDIQLLKAILSRNGENYEAEQLEETAKRAEHWITRWYPQKLIQVNERPDRALHATLNATERQWIEAFRGLLRNERNDDEQLMEDIYAICRVEDKKVMKQNQKRLFSLLYQLVLQSNEGPRMPYFIQGVGRERLLSLLDFN
ncbi:hypothetical protein GZH47_26295 [Paenibacillus rhizovicinus]|uniref:Lysine--tRNA ligase n=1 Tax=Paenibacillus rhizovicinus TaxID=2704463 RepID=A0A6C0P5X7_9BACL|nr:hypothetical protein [Paenibacillus rhizovicinus]QHW33960.1 hypothetical protein GZH47_26295 [Paenibacillus rhizovicinus]